MTRPRLLLSLLLLGLTSCRCGKKTDEERLKEKLDRTPVHLYLASKLALTQGSTDPDVLSAREQVLSLLSAAAALSQKPAADAPAAAKVELDPRVAARLGLSLLKLKGQGAELLRSGGDAQLAPVTESLLALWLKKPSPPLDRDLDHALLMTGLFLLKSHPRSPVPVPEELLLYEASRTQPDGPVVAPAAPLLRALKAFIYATNALCDLAATEVSALPTQGQMLDGAALAQLLGRLGAAKVDLSQLSMPAADNSLFALGHGSTALCYLQRDEKAKARVHLKEFIARMQSIEEVGREVHLISAYLALEEKDTAGAKSALLAAKAAARTTPEQREELDRLLVAVDANDQKLLGKYFNRYAFAKLLSSVAFQELDRSGLDDAVADSPPFVAVRSFLESAAKALQAVHPPSTDEVKEKAKGLFSRWFD